MLSKVHQREAVEVEPRKAMTWKFKCACAMYALRHQLPRGAHIHSVTPESTIKEICDCFNWEVTNFKTTEWKKKTGMVLFMLRGADGNYVLRGGRREHGEPGRCTDYFDFDHIVPRRIGGAHHPVNVEPILKSAHIEKTKKDAAVIAKARRFEKVAKGERSRKRKGRPLPGTKASGIKKPMNGKATKREPEAT